MIILNIILFCWKRLARSFPSNLFLIGIISLLEAYWLSDLVSNDTLDSSNIVLIMWTSTLFGMTVYAFWKKTFILIHKSIKWGMITLVISAIFLFIFKSQNWRAILISLFILPLFLVYVAINTNLVLKTHRFGVYS